MSAIDRSPPDPAAGPRTACHVCGAPYDGEPSLYCRSCRAKQATGVADLEAYRANPERFELVRAHPAFAAAARWSPRLRASVELAQPITVFVIASVWSIGIAAIIWSKGDSEMRWASAAVAAAIVLGASVAVATAARRLFARSQQVVAVIAEDVARPARGGDPAGVANHQVTLRTADGRNRDVLATDAQMGLVALTDIGLAYLQGDRLVDFRRFDVMPAPLGADEPARPPTCATCAAPYSFESRTHCLYCGGALAHPDLGEHGARFARILEAPETAAARAQPVALWLPPIGTAVVLLAAAGFVLYGLLWRMRYLWFFLAEEWPWGLVALVPLIGVVLFAAIYGRRRLAPRVARRVAEVSLIVRTRDDAWATVNGRPVIAHFVTLAGPGGGRVECRVMPPVARAVRPGQIGVAHLRGTWLAGWTPLDEPAPVRGDE